MSVTKSTESQKLIGTDDDNIDNFFDDFQNASNVPKIYDYVQSSVNDLNLSVQDVISEVTIATRALQKADKVVNKTKLNITSQNSKFVPISLLQPSAKVPKQATVSKFETQYFSNTQLINVVENAEAIYESRKGITQEFDVEFAPNVPTLQCSVYSQDNVIKESRSPSPILSSKKSSNSSTPRLTVNLDVFEKFENIATSFINSDKFNIEEAKVLIHSQILNNEIELHGDCTNNVDKYNSDHHLVQEFEKRDVAQKKDCSTTGSFLDDEILFSSDEEEYVHKDFKDLPSTCELYTSDNESEILDKTLYVGFITANNRPISVTSDSYYKANNIFNETVSEIELNPFDKNSNKDDDISMSPVLNRIGKTSLNVIKKEIVKNTQPKTSSKKNNSKPNKPLTRKDVIFKMLKDELVSGSKSEGDNTIKTSPAKSKSSIIKHHQMNPDAFSPKNKDVLEEDLFSDDLSFNDLGCTQDYNELSTFKNNNAKSNEHLSDEVLAKTKHWFNNIDKANNRENALKAFNDEIENVNIVHKFKGFRTASNKKIDISDTALAKTRHLLQNIKENEEILNDNINIPTNVDIELTDVASPKSVEIFDDVDDNIETLKNVNSKIESIKKADDQNNHISNQALNSTEHIFEDIDILIMSEIKESTINTDVGFKTASNKNVQISEKALARSKHIFQGIDGDEEKPTHSEKELVGFKTANNKNVQISEKALSMSKHIFKGIVEEEPIFQEMNGEVPTCSGDKEIVGFKTASNKNVQISEKALAMSKHIFQGIDGDEEKPTHSQKKIVGFKTASNKNVKISEKALSMSKHIFQGIVEEEPTFSGDKEIVGFKTASNKNVRISEKALAMSKHIFQGIDGDEEIPTHSAKEIVGFKTASNKNVQISEKALSMSKHIFQGIDGDEPTSSGDKEIVRFKTASNKNVQISEKVLAMSNHIFQGIDGDEEKPTHSEKKIVGFKTASNKNVQISEKALSMSKHIFQGIVEEEPTRSGVGFKTASNKNVPISHEALAKTKCLFRDIDIVENNTIHSNDIVVGFKTASNKDVKISEKALSNTKHFFKNIVVEEQELIDESNDKQKSNDPILGNTLDMLDYDAINMDLKTCNKNVSTFGGFFTANNKTIKVSEESLVDTKNLFKDDTSIIPKFEGFKTGNNNTVEISENALVKSKCLLQNLPGSSINISDFSNCKDDYLNNKEETNFNDIIDGDEMSQILKGFTTANNKSVTVSKESILKSKNLFEESSHKLKNNNDIITNLFDTQLTKDFEHNLYTEDFCKESQVRKRPASPILNYSKAKRMKLTSNNEKTFTVKFDENYKKHKIMTLKNINDVSNIKSNDPFILKYDFDNILNMEFEGERNNLTDYKLTIVDIIDIFKESVNKHIIPEGWVENHIKLILWKLISYEIKFPKKMKGICNVTELMNQLKYRYDRELYNVERPALRKILEKDESPAKTMILCVVRIFSNNVSVSSITNKSDTIELEVTDGWYCLRVVIDRMLTKLVHQGKISVGTKVVTQGAELVNCEHGVPPWENTSNVRLKISANATRRVFWYSKLGFHRGGITTYLPHVMVGGGRVPKVRVFVSRVYPLLYVERLEDGSTVTRTERQEEIYQIKYEAERQLRMEKLYEEVSKEQSDIESQCTGQVGENSMNTGSQIARAMRAAKDPDEFRATLTESQLSAYQNYQTKKRDLMAEDMRKIVDERLKEDQPRSVVSLLKLRINGFYMKDVSMSSCGSMLSIWRVGGEILESVAEGMWIDLYNVVPTGMRNSELQLSAGRQTMIDVCKTNEKKYSAFTKQFRRKPIAIADLVDNPNMKSPYNEFDIAGVIFHIEPTTEEFEVQEKKTSNFQNVFLTDRQMKFVCINFWGGIRKTGFEKLLTIGQIIIGMNLRSRIGNSGKTIPQFRFLDTSYFTKSPKNKDLKINFMGIVDAFNGIDIAKFCKECVGLKSQMSTLNKYKRNVFESPLPNLDDFDLRAADFESTFKQSQSPSSLKKSMVNEKIDKLRKMYGEPPPLSPICIKNRGANVTKSYKSPFLGSVANIENQGETEATSPVLKKRSVKRVFSGNPVKLDFCQNENLVKENSSSPPMSLD